MLSRLTDKRLVIAVFVLSILGMMTLHWWRGPIVTVYRIDPQPLVQTVVAAGRVVTPVRAQIGSEITGVVLERRVQEGDKVERGDVLLILRADDMAAQVQQAQAALRHLETISRPQAAVALQRAEIQLDQAKRETLRRRELAARSLLSAEALELSVQQETLARAAVESARLNVNALAPGGNEEIQLQGRLQSLQAQLAKSTVRSEIAGTILTRHVEPGDLAQPGRVLFTVAQGNQTEILVAIDEKNLPLLALEQEATVIADAYPDQPFAARLTYLAPSIDPERGSIDVRLTVDNVPDFLRQDMTVSVNIETARRPSALVIRNDALSTATGDTAQVVTVRDGKLQRETVSLGLRGLTETEVIKGLSAGDLVLTDPSVPDPDGTRVRISEQTLASSHDHSASDSNTRNELPVKLN